jgi:hypothetical protein
VDGNLVCAFGVGTISQTIASITFTVRTREPAVIGDAILRHPTLGDIETIDLMDAAGTTPTSLSAVLANPGSYSIAQIEAMTFVLSIADSNFPGTCRVYRMSLDVVHENAPICGAIPLGF